RHVDEVLGVEDTGLPKIRAVERVRGDREQMRMEKLDPFAIFGARHLSRIAAVVAEDVEILGQVEVDAPVVALHMIGGALAGLELVTGEIEDLALGILPVVPEGFAVESP